MAFSSSLVAAGSGKTLAFMIPALACAAQHAEQPGPTVLVLQPTKELQLQSYHVVKRLAAGLGLAPTLMNKAAAAGSDFEKVSMCPDVSLALPHLACSDTVTAWRRGVCFSVDILLHMLTPTRPAEQCCWLVLLASQLPQAAKTLPQHPHPSGVCRRVCSSPPRCVLCEQSSAGAWTQATSGCSSWMRRTTSWLANFSTMWMPWSGL